MGTLASIEKDGLSLIVGGGTRHLRERVLTIDRYAQDGSTLKVALTLADGREVALSIYPGEQITAHAL